MAKKLKRKSAVARAPKKHVTKLHHNPMPLVWILMGFVLIFTITYILSH